MRYKHSSKKPHGHNMKKLTKFTTRILFANIWTRAKYDAEL